MPLRFTHQMILKKERKVNFTYFLHKILRIAPAFNNTFVLLGVIKTGMNEIILHIDNEGKELYKFISNQPINVISMPNDRNVIFCANHQSKIHAIDLQSHTKRSFSHEFIGDATAAIIMYFFPNTQLLAILESGNTFDHQLSITYYQTFSSADKMIDQSLIKDGEYRYNDVICKGNSDSMILWSHCKQNNTVVIYIYEIKSSQEKNGSLRMVELRNSIINRDRTSSIYTISNMWELKKNEILLVSQINETGTKPDSRPCRVYILEINQLTIIEIEMPFDKYQTHVMILSFNLGEFSVFPITKIGAQSLKTTLYIPNTYQQFISPFPLENHALFHPMLPEYDKQSICIFLYENYCPKTFKALMLSIATQKELLLQLLLHVNEDFDDDLLFDAMTMLQQQ